MDSLSFLLFASMLVFIITVLNPFWVLPIFIFGHFIEPMKYFPMLREYNPGAIIGMVVVIAWFIHLVIYRDHVSADSRQVTMLWLFILWMTISTGINSDSGWGKLFLVSRVIIPYFFFLYMIKTRQQLTIAVWLLLILGAVAGLYGIYCLKANIGISDRGFKRISSFFSNPNDLGQTLVLLIPILLGLLFYHYPKFIKCVLLFMLALIVTGVVISLSRKCFFALFVAIFAFVFRFFKKEMKIVAIIATIFLVLVAAYFFPSKTKYRYWSRVSTIFNAESAESLDLGRTETNKAGWKMIAENPFLGVGLGGFVDEYISITEENQDIILVGDEGLVAHNLYVEVGAQLGAVGLAIYLFMIAFAFKDSMVTEKIARSINDDWLRIFAVTFQVYIIVFMFIGVFSGILGSKIFWIMTPLSAVMKRITMEQKDNLADIDNMPQEASVS